MFYKQESVNKSLQDGRSWGAKLARRLGRRSLPNADSRHANLNLTQLMLVVLSFALGRRNVGTQGLGWPPNEMLTICFLMQRKSMQAYKQRTIKLYILKKTEAFPVEGGWGGDQEEELNSFETPL